jgi:predicted metalloprotease with PDZ domain
MAVRNNNNSINISLDLSNYSAHLIKVIMVLNNAVPKQKISMPVWTPGSYMVREFAQHIVTIEAKENEELIEVRKINKNTFILDNKLSHVTISYQVYAFDSSIRAAYIDNLQCYFNGTALFFLPADMLDKEYTLTIHAPSSWQGVQVASNLKKIDVDSNGFGTYLATSYNDLVDHPFQISAMRRLNFMVDKIPHELVLTGDIRSFDEEKLVKDLSKLCKSHFDLFSGQAPFSSYVFIARLEEGSHGGLEHQDSSMLLASPYCLPRKSLEEPDNNYKNFLSLCSHEYFHAWNVKKLRPRNFLSYDYDQECYTNLLWLFEGITSYYDDLQVHRSGLILLNSYLDIVSKNITKLLKTKGRKVQTLADSSFDAWIKLYRPNENSQNSSVSYYLKGALVALMLDLLIRLNTNNRASLDVVMRQALEKFGHDGISEADFFALVAAIGGIDVNWFKQSFIYGTKELELTPLFDKFGISLVLSKDEMFTDDKTKMTAFLGAKIKFDDRGQGIITFVEQGSPAMLAGLCPNDEVIGINNIRLDTANVSDLLLSMNAGQILSITYGRKKNIKYTQLIPDELPIRVCKLFIKKQLALEEKRNLSCWLNFKGE